MAATSKTTTESVSLDDVIDLDGVRQHCKFAGVSLVHVLDNILLTRNMPLCGLGERGPYTAINRRERRHSRLFVVDVFAIKSERERRGGGERGEERERRERGREEREERERGKSPRVF